MVVTTLGDLDNFYIKRSYVRKDIEYVYMFHHMTSMDMTSTEGEYDNYDTLLCTGPHPVSYTHLDVYKRQPYDIVFNCAAYTDVDGCESNEADAYAINAAGVANLARACCLCGAVLVHVLSLIHI